MLALVALLALMTVVAGVFAVLYVTGSSSAEHERNATETAIQGLQACQDASNDLLTALNGTPDAQATKNALTRMSTSCQ